MSSEEHPYIYSFKPRLMGGSYDFMLSENTLDWSMGLQSGRLSYPMIKHIRLGYKPTSMASARFIAEIWPVTGQKLTLYSVSQRSLIDMSNQGDDYNRFLRELHRRTAAAKANCTFEAGFPAWRWWPAVIAGIGTSGLLVFIIYQALVGGHYALAGAIVVLGAWFLWQIWNIVKRNRPRFYDPKNLPEDVLPAASK